MNYILSVFTLRIIVIRTVNLSGTCEAVYETTHKPYR